MPLKMNFYHFLINMKQNEFQTTILPDFKKKSVKLNKIVLKKLVQVMEWDFEDCLITRKKPFKALSLLKIMCTESTQEGLIKHSIYFKSIFQKCFQQITYFFRINKNTWWNLLKEVIDIILESVWRSDDLLKEVVHNLGGEFLELILMEGVPAIYKSRILDSYTSMLITGLVPTLSSQLKFNLGRLLCSCGDYCLQHGLMQLHMLLGVPPSLPASHPCSRIAPPSVKQTFDQDCRRFLNHLNMVEKQVVPLLVETVTLGYDCKPLGLLGDCWADLNGGSCSLTVECDTTIFGRSDCVDSLRVDLKTVTNLIFENEKLILEGAKVKARSPEIREQLQQRGPGLALTLVEGHKSLAAMAQLLPPSLKAQLESSIGPSTPSAEKSNERNNPMEQQDLPTDVIPATPAPASPKSSLRRPKISVFTLSSSRAKKFEVSKPVVDKSKRKIEFNLAAGVVERHEENDFTPPNTAEVLDSPASDRWNRIIDLDDPSEERVSPSPNVVAHLSSPEVNSPPPVAQTPCVQSEEAMEVEDEQIVDKKALKKKIARVAKTPMPKKRIPKANKKPAKKRQKAKEIEKEADVVVDRPSNELNVSTRKKLYNLQSDYVFPNDSEQSLPNTCRFSYLEESRPANRLDSARKKKSTSSVLKQKKTPIKRCTKSTAKAKKENSTKVLNAKTTPWHDNIFKAKSSLLDQTMRQQAVPSEELGPDDQCLINYSEASDIPLAKLASIPQAAMVELGKKTEPKKKVKLGRKPYNNSKKKKELKILPDALDISLPDLTVENQVKHKKKESSLIDRITENCPRLNTSITVEAVPRAASPIVNSYGKIQESEVVRALSRSPVYESQSSAPNISTCSSQEPPAVVSPVGKSDSISPKVAASNKSDISCGAAHSIMRSPNSNPKMRECYVRLTPFVTVRRPTWNLDHSQFISDLSKVTTPQSQSSVDRNIEEEIPLPLSSSQKKINESEIISSPLPQAESLHQNFENYTDQQLETLISHYKETQRLLERVLTARCTP